MEERKREREGKCEEGKVIKKKDRKTDIQRERGWVKKRE